MPRDICIAFVDDDRHLAELVREVLGKKGWTVDTYGAAEELLAADLNSYRVILLDLYLPGMWGSECAYKLREMGIATPIVAVTGHADEWDEEDLRDLGFDSVLAKPFDTNALVPVVEKAMQGSRSEEKEQA
jgi:two-component system OmpR family response regulator